jgi:hypothetical protein
MGIAAAVVYSWEDNTRQPDGQQLKSLARVLGCSLVPVKDGLAPIVWTGDV